MKKRYLKKVAVLVIAVLLLNVVAGPSAMARYLGEDVDIPVESYGACGFGNPAGEGPVKGVEVEELTGADLEEAVKKAYDNEDVQALQRFLKARRYALQTNKAIKVVLGDELRSKAGIPDVLVVTMSFEAGRTAGSAELVFLTSDAKTIAGVGIIHETRDGAKIVRAFDAFEGAVTYTSTISRSRDGAVRIQTADGKEFMVPARTSSSRPPGKAAPLALTVCDTCEYVCEMIQGVLGCSIAGYLVCNLICLGFAGPACPAICGILFAFICGTGTYFTCPYICEMMGYCP
jgi:hypothetical protein